MNTLSWLIYAGSVTGDLKGFLIVVSIGAVGGLIAWFISVAMHNDFACDEDKRKYPSLKWLAVPLATGCIACALPSSSTVYAIAASEMGERALHTETAGKAVQALNAWLDKQIAPAKEEDK